MLAPFESAVPGQALAQKLSRRTSPKNSATALCTSGSSNVSGGLTAERAGNQESIHAPVREAKRG